MDILTPYVIGCITASLCTLELHFKVCEGTVRKALNPVLVAAFLLLTAYSWIGVLIAIITAVGWYIARGNDRVEKF
tara:strand:- start:135 stop:362 length:228 start_codon:yes stop_codon:yes gene_type:complete